MVLGGLAAGWTRDELAEKYDKIVRFAELKKFMDYPMRTYSSGMYGRLAFSVAVNMDPDILLIDEALSVGDPRFKRKSMRRMRSCARPTRRSCSSATRSSRSRTSATTSSGCTRASCKMWDEPEAVIEAYTEFLEVGEDAVTMEDI